MEIKEKGNDLYRRLAVAMAIISTICGQYNRNYKTDIKITILLANRHALVSTKSLLKI